MGIAKSYTKSYEQKFLADFEEEMRSINKGYSSILNIDDKKFGNSFNALVDLVTAEVDNLPKFVKIIRRKSFNKAQEFERVRTYLSKASQLKAQSVKRLYELVSLI